MSFRVLVGLAGTLLLACGDSQSAADGGRAASGSADGGQAAASGWLRLVEDEWTLGPGDEALNQCTKHVLEEDLYVSALRPVHPTGTHHTTLSMTDDDGTSDCSDNQTAVFQNGLVYGAAVGTEGLELPPGVAMRFPAGKALNMALHLFNTSTDELSGLSAIEVKTIPESEVEHVAEAMMVGPLSLSIPVARPSSTPAR
jgi:hypothetical protein